jgi:Icc protein
MRIVQLTDLHIGLEGEDTYGVDVRENFQKIKAAISALQPDHIVVSGDLCYRDGQQSIYTWVKAQLDDLGLPYDVISGNHDDPVMLANTFGLQADLHDGQVYYAKELGGKPVLFLDTTTGIVSTTQLEWLKAQLAANPTDIIIFMHHPPLLAGVPFMDNKYALKNRDEVLEVLFAHPHQISVFTGHYHVEKYVQQKNVAVFITPSCFFQLDQTEEDFKVDHYQIGFREITLNGTKLMHTVKYL